MPCFKGLAVSIHTPNGALQEHAVQKTSRLSRISTYIPVPPPQIPVDSITNRPEQSTFAISITLLTPGQDVPYSAPKPSSTDPYPPAKRVGSLPGHGNERGKFTGAIGPYVPLTTSPNETIAAYIYFDGRVKEEVATLLRKGEETWVNSRWVGVPESEGGGLAEREFLFREVGLERWLNGLDLDGKDAAATIERRKQKLEKRRRKRKDAAGSDDEANGDVKPKHTLRYGTDGELQELSEDEESLSDTDSSEDDDPIPETAGQIKVALFRVLASGEIKRGEYSPQFDAHDDDDEVEGRNGHANGEAQDGANVDHTTSFAKPKTLDPKTISTQTVTGIDPTDKPYAVFTFLYRGERQLQKMGILPTPKSDKTPTSTKRRSLAVDLPSFAPLKKEGTVGFANFRDTDARVKSKPLSKKKHSDEDEMESDSDDDDGTGIIGKMEDINEADITKKEHDSLSPEDAERAGMVAEGIRKMKLKRQHSAEPLNGKDAREARKSSKSGSPSAASTPQVGNGFGRSASPPATAAISTGVEPPKDGDDGFLVGSPMKRQRASMAEFDEAIKNRLGGGGLPTSGTISEVLGSKTGGAGSVTTTGPNTALGGGSGTGSGAADQFGGMLMRKGIEEGEDEDEEL